MEALIYAVVAGVVIGIPALTATYFMTSRARVSEVWENVAKGYKEEVDLRDETIKRMREQANMNRERIASLEGRVTELSGRDQGAVLDALQHLEEAILQRLDAWKAG